MIRSAINFGLEQNLSSEFIFRIMKIMTVSFYSLLKTCKNKKFHTAVCGVILTEAVERSLTKLIFQR